jgi:hypothetical protein
MERIIHKITQMIACHIGDKAIVLMQKDFNKVFEQLMTDLSPLDTFAFKNAVFHHLAIGKANSLHKKWETIFRDRLIAEIKEGRFDPTYDLEGQEAIDFVEEFLEGFRYSYRSINYAVGYLHDGSDEIINISLRREQSLLDKVLNRYGTSYSEINILKHDIQKLSGSSLDFTLFTSRIAYQFSPNGVRHV